MSSRSFGEVGKTGGQRTAYRISQSEQLLPKPITIPALGREPQAGLLSSFELRSMSQPESGSRQILRWRRQSRANPSLKQAHVGGQLTRGARGYKNKLGNNPMRRPTEGNVRVAQERAMDV